MNIEDINMKIPGKAFHALTKGARSLADAFMYATYGQTYEVGPVIDPYGRCQFTGTYTADSDRFDDMVGLQKKIH